VRRVSKEEEYIKTGNKKKVDGYENGARKKHDE
jgi:hypothetical protein